MIATIVVCFAGYFGFLIGRRWESGVEEAEADFVEQQQYQRGLRNGTVTLNRITFKR